MYIVHMPCMNMCVCVSMSVYFVRVCVCVSMRAHVCVHIYYPLYLCILNVH